MATKKAATKKKPATKRKSAAKKKAARNAGQDVSVRTASAKNVGATNLLAPLDNLEKVFETFLERRWPRHPRWEWPRWSEMSSLLEEATPSVDVIDRAKEVVVRAAVPGIEKNDLDVSIVERTLTIKGSSRHEEKEEGEGYFRQEIRSGAFSRSIDLPTDVNAAKAKAKFEGGVLELHLPKVRAPKKRQIALQ